MIKNLFSHKPGRKITKMALKSESLELRLKLGLYSQ